MEPVLARVGRHLFLVIGRLEIRLPAWSAAASTVVDWGIHQKFLYVDHILKGEKPADLPMQAPTEYELVNDPKPA